MTDLRKLLDDATPRPWAHDGVGNVDSVKSDQLNGGFHVCECYGTDNPENAELITEAVNQLPALLDRIEKLEGALRFYADEDNHTECSVMITQLVYATPISKDLGQRAKEALKP